MPTKGQHMTSILIYNLFLSKTEKATDDANFELELISLKQREFIYPKE